MKRIVIAIFFALLFCLCFALPVSAATIPNPDISILVVSCQVVRSVIEDDDIAVVFHYGINYTAYPITVPASESFFLRFYDIDGTTILAETKPYVYIDNGYNDNMASFYFDKATAAGMTWQGAYQIGIVPNTLNFASPPANYYYVLSNTNYTVKTTPEDNHAVIVDYLRNNAVALQGIYSGLTLLVTTDVGTVLTSDGDNWFRNAMPGVASFAPDLFYIQYYVPQAEDLHYTNDLGISYATRATGWDITTGLDYLATVTGLDSAGTVAAFGSMILALIFVIFCAYKGWGVEPGLIGSMMAMECSALLFGGTLLNIVLFGALIAGMFVFFILLLRRA
jgi:hypothetical protein